MLEAFLFCVVFYVVLEITAEIWVRFRSRKVHWVARFESSQGEVAYVRGYGRRRIGRSQHQRIINPDTGTVTNIIHATHSIAAIRRSDWEFVRFKKYEGQPYLTRDPDTRFEDDTAIHALHETVPMDVPIVTQDLRPPESKPASLD